MNLRSTITRSAVALMLVAGPQLAAQEQTGTLSGLTQGPDGKALAGARVTLQSPALFAPRTVVSNDKGEWRVPLLAVGNYTVKATKEGFVGPTIKDVRVGMGTGQRLDLKFRAMVEAGAVVEVSAPVVAQSAAEVKVAINYSGEQLWRIPVIAIGGGGIFEQAKILSPGVVTDNNNSKNGIRGTQSDAIGYFIDGVDVKDGGINAFTPIPDYVEDVQVVQSAVNAKDGRQMGGRINILTKSGGNEFAGSVRLTYHRVSRRANYFAGYSNSDADNSRDGIARTWNLTASGPIWKDHIWFSIANSRAAGTTSSLPLFTASGTPSNASAVLMPQPNVGGTNYPFEAYLTNVADKLRTPPPGTTIPLYDMGANIKGVGDSSFWDTKLTALLFADHTLSLSTSYRRGTSSPSASDFAGFVQNWIKVSQFGTGSTVRNSYSLNYRGSITSRLQVEAQYGRYTYESISYAAPDTAENPMKVYTALSNGRFASSYTTWGGAFPLFGTTGQDQKRSNANASLRFKYLADWKGSHELDFGIESVAMTNNPGYPEPGSLTRVGVGGYFVNASGGMSFPTIRFVGATLNGQQAGFANLISGDNFTRAAPAPIMINFWASNGDMVDRTKVIYVNDSWALDSNWSFNLGLRFSRFTVENTDGSSVLDTTMPEPRFQVKWDPTGKGVHVFSLTLARYAQEFTTTATSPWLVAANTVYTVRGWAGFGGQPLPGDPADGGNYGVRYVDYAQLTNPSNYLPTHYFRDARQQLTIDPGIKPAYNDEIAFNYRHAVKGGFVNLAVAQRTYKNTVLSALDYGLDNFQVVKDPSGQGAASKRVQLTRYLNSPFETKFTSLELSWQQAITTRFLFNGSYSYMKSTGVSESGVLNYLSLRNDPRYGLTGLERVPEGTLMRMQKLKVAWTYTHPVKGGDIAVTLFGDYLHDPNVTAASSSMLYRYINDANGTPILQPMPTTDPNGLAVQTIGDPSFTRYYSSLGQYRVQNDMYSANLKVDWNIPLDRKVRLIGSFSITNVFNMGTSFIFPGITSTASTTSGVPGRLMYDYTYAPGSYGSLTGTSERSRWNPPRSFSEVTIGLRF